jgi:hypothetical protein
MRFARVKSPLGDERVYGEKSRLIEKTFYSGIQLKISDSDRIMGIRINLAYRKTKHPICPRNQGIAPK